MTLGSTDLSRYGFVANDTIDTSGTTSSYTLTINNASSSSTKAGLVCVAGTIAMNTDTGLPCFRLMSSGGNECNASYMAITGVSTSTAYAYGGSNKNVRLCRYYVGNANANTSNSGERISFILWICDQKHTSRPFANTHVYGMCVPSGNNSRLYLTHVQATFFDNSGSYDRQQKIKFVDQNGSSFLGAKIKAWQLGAL